MIPLDDVVLRHDLDPRLGDRDDGLIEQYADIFDALPPIEINQHNEVIDGWHRYLAAKRAKRTDIAYVVVETKDDEDLADRMWESNLRHGVQYSREQRKTQGVKLHGRGLSAKEIADRVGVGVNTVYRWTKALREQDKQERDQAIIDLRDAGKTHREIAAELGIPRQTVTDILAGNPQMVETGQAIADTVETKHEPVMKPEEPPPEESAPEPEPPTEAEREDPQPEPETGDVPAEEEPVTPEPEPPSLPEELLETEPELEAETQLQESEIAEDIFAFTAPLGFLGTLSVRWQSAVRSKLRDKHRRGNDETSD